MNLALELAASRAPLSLTALTLSASSVAEDASVGTVVGAIQGGVIGSTITLTNDAGGKFSKSGNNIQVAAALDYETATSHQITLREYHFNAAGTRDTTLTITVTDVSEGPVLGPDLVTNGGFTSNLNSWTATNWSWSNTFGSEAMTLDNGATLEQAITLTDGATYRLTFTVLFITSVGVTPRVGGTNGTTRNSTGTFTQDIVAGALDTLRFTNGAGGSAYIDTVTLQLVT